MADISPTVAFAGKVPVVKWTIPLAADTPLKFTASDQWGLAGCAQITGTFAGSTVKLQMSNDGSNWVDIKDLQGTILSTTAANMFEFTCSAVYIKPVITGGAATDIIITLALRGLY